MIHCRMYCFRLCIKKSCGHRKMCIYFKSPYVILAYSAVFYLSSEYIGWVWLLINYNWYVLIKFTSLRTFRGEMIRSLHAGNSLMQGVKPLMAGCTPKRTWPADTHMVWFILTFGVCMNMFTHLSTRMVHTHSPLGHKFQAASRRSALTLHSVCTMWTLKV